MKRAALAIACVVLHGCSFATQPRQRSSPPAAPSCPLAPPLIDAGLGISAIAASIYWAKEVEAGPWRDVPRGLLISAALATGMIVAFGSALYGTQAGALCTRFEEATAKQREIRERRLEAWELVKRSTASSNCAVAIELGPRVERLDRDLYETAMAPTVERCLEIPPRGSVPQPTPEASSGGAEPSPLD